MGVCNSAARPCISLEKTTISVLTPNGRISLEKTTISVLTPNGHIRAFAYDPTTHVLSTVEAGHGRSVLSLHLQRETSGKVWVNGLTRGRHEGRFKADGYEIASVDVNIGPDLTEVTEVHFSPQS